MQHPESNLEMALLLSVCAVLWHDDADWRCDKHMQAAGGECDLQGFAVLS